MDRTLSMEWNYKSPGKKQTNSQWWQSKVKRIKKIHFINNLTWARHFSCSHYVQTLQTMISSSPLDIAIMIYKGEGRKEEETEVNNWMTTHSKVATITCQHISFFIHTWHTYFWNVFVFWEEQQSTFMTLVPGNFLKESLLKDCNSEKFS